MDTKEIHHVEMGEELRVLRIALRELISVRDRGKEEVARVEEDMRHLEARIRMIETGVIATRLPVAQISAAPVSSAHPPPSAAVKKKARRKWTEEQKARHRLKMKAKWKEWFKTGRRQPKPVQ